MIKKLSLNKFALISSLALTPFILNGCAAMLVTGSSAATTTVTQDSRTFSSMLYDEAIEQDAYQVLKSNGKLSQPENFSITVTAFNGNVLITGQTIYKDYLKWAVAQIQKIEHVRKVYNYATLQKPVPASVVSSDSLITSKVKTQLLFGKDINSNRFKVVTENGNVFLMGIVNRDESARAINTVLSVAGVRKVYHIFDFIEVEATTRNGANAQENLQVTPVKGSRSAYQRPHNAASNSSYVPPVQVQQNGGAYIVEDVEPIMSRPASNTMPVNTSDDDLLRPAN